MFIKFEIEENYVFKKLTYQKVQSSDFAGSFLGVVLSILVSNIFLNMFGTMSADLIDITILLYFCFCWFMIFRLIFFQKVFYFNYFNFFFYFNYLIWFKIF